VVVPAGPSDSGTRTDEGTGTVTVLFFAAAREAAGAARATVAGEGQTVEGLAAHLRSRYGPDLTAALATCAIWVNGVAVPPATVLQAGDEVAVLPPVSGG